MPDTIPIEQLTYEAAFAELEGIVSALESNQRPLDESMALFERGQTLAAHCASLLDQAELRIRQLTGEELLGEVEEEEEPEE